MTVPGFESNGGLPPGEHEATWEEVVDRYGHNDHRAALLVGLENAIKDLKRAGASKVLIDGSFVTEKAQPNDFDACYEIDDTDLVNLTPELLDMRYPRRAMKGSLSRRVVTGSLSCNPMAAVGDIPPVLPA